MTTFFWTLIESFLILIITTDETDEGVNLIVTCYDKKKTGVRCQCFLFWIWKKSVTMKTIHSCIFSLKRTETSLPLRKNGSINVSLCLITHKPGQWSWWKIFSKTLSRITRKIPNSRHKRPSRDTIYFIISRKRVPVGNAVITKINRFVRGSNGPPTW